jgi:hypothetical protein
MYPPSGAAASMTMADRYRQTPARVTQRFCEGRRRVSCVMLALAHDGRVPLSAAAILPSLMSIATNRGTHDQVFAAGRR